MVLGSCLFLCHYKIILILAMRFFYKPLISIFFSISSLLAFGQADINNESFTSTFVKTKDGGQVIFNGKNHAFSVNIPGTTVTEEKLGNAGENQNFIHCGGTVIQTSWVPLPQPVPENMQLSNLTREEQQETLDGYVNYELDYFTNELKTKPLNFTKEWITVGSRLFLGMEL
ncbi:MAG: hypothetical protein JWP37_798 [Mucilaginibacter sp.]|nr:hypothetical protein [Mucilaginibacter sp.]